MCPVRQCLSKFVNPPLNRPARLFWPAVAAKAPVPRRSLLKPMAGSADFAATFPARFPARIINEITHLYGLHLSEPPGSLERVVTSKYGILGMSFAQSCTSEFANPTIKRSNLLPYLYAGVL